MNTKGRSSEELYQKYPNYKVYTQCQQKAFITGSFAFVSGFAGLYLAQEFLKDYLPYKRTSFFLPPVILGSIASYLVTRWKTKECQAMWMALEEKHTALTPIEDKKDP